MKENLLIDKSLMFASKIVLLYQNLSKKENIISKQIIRSATSIGANISEANYGQSKADFTAKMQIALKETAETEYWLRLLCTTNYIDKNEGEKYIKDCLELKKLLIATIKTVKG